MKKIVSLFIFLLLLVGCSLSNSPTSKVEELLNKYGSDKENILSITIYVKDMKDFADMNAVYDAWVAKGHEPARACVEAKMARENLLVEMSVVAAVK